MLSDLKEHYWAIVLRTIQYWQKNIDQRSRTENPELNSCCHLIYNKGTKNICEEKTVSSINRVGKTGQLHAKEWNQTTFLTPYTTVDSKWVKDEHIRPGAIKILV